MSEDVTSANPAAMHYCSILFLLLSSLFTNVCNWIGDYNKRMLSLILDA